MDQGAPPNDWLKVPSGDLDQLPPNKTAILVVDMQYFDAHPDFGMGADAKGTGLWSRYEEYFRRLENVVPRMRHLLDAARAHGYQVLFTAVLSHTSDSRDIGRMHRRFNLRVVPGSRDADILDELGCLDTEPVLTKTCSSIFNHGEIQTVLGNLRIENLVVCGVMTNYCVEGTVRDACDRNYNVVVAGDLCASISDEWHEFALAVMDSSFAFVTSSDVILQELEAQGQKAMAPA